MMAEEPAEPTSEINLVNNLGTELIEFAESLPYWGQYLSSRLISGQSITEEDVKAAYSFLLDDAGLIEIPEKPDLNFTYTERSAKNYKTELVLNKIQKVEGVNSLVENQTIEFCPHVTVIYGMNGSGKSSYVRLLKKAFFNRADENIIHNIHLESGHKSIGSEFYFSSNGGTSYRLQYPADLDRAEFEQFAVFDSKSVHVHLNNKNQFEFRPSGLSFFGDLTEAYKKVEKRLEEDTFKRNQPKDYASFFDGESEIKELIKIITHETKIETLTQFLPFEEEDKEFRKKLEEEKAKLQTQKKDKEVADLLEKRSLLEGLKQKLISNNACFTAVALEKINNKINDCIEKESLAKNSGISNFKNEALSEIGGNEWRTFIEAAGSFAKIQGNNNPYPAEDDLCLLCHQPLTEEAQTLINSYWSFLKSQAEKNSKDAQAELLKIKTYFENLTFNLVSGESILGKWLEENHKELLTQLSKLFSQQEDKIKIILACLETKSILECEEVLIDTSILDIAFNGIETKVAQYKEQDSSLLLDAISQQIAFYNHKEKLGEHINNMLEYIGNLNWAQLANTVKKNFNKRRITDKEKELSKKYFSDAYIDLFNRESEDLKAKFEIDIRHTGTEGASFRQLQFKGNQPSLILSEGEQKVISLADFLSEMQLSNINKGIIFDDPVTSLDSERKQSIAERLVKLAKERQVIIFTHDLVFYNCLYNASKTYLRGIDNCFKSHTIDRITSTSCGRVTLNFSPSNQNLFKDSKKAADYLNKSRTCSGEEVLVLLRSGYSSLRTSYEYLISTVIVGGVVQRFNPQIRVGNLKDMKFDSSIIEEVVQNHGEISDFIDGHLPLEEAGLFPTPEKLEDHIQKYESISARLKSL